MPTYEYACKSCGEHLEVVQSFTDDALTTCPQCSGPLRKVFGNIGIAFKGSGFYKTDSRSSTSKSSSTSTGTDNSKTASSDSGGAAESGGKGAGSSETPSSPAPASPSPAKGDSASTTAKAS